MVAGIAGDAGRVFRVSENNLCCFRGLFLFSRTRREDFVMDNKEKKIASICDDCLKLKLMNWLRK